MAKLPTQLYIILGNFIVLILLLLLWTTDCIESSLNENQIWLEIAKIIGISILAWFTIHKIKNGTLENSLLKKASEKIVFTSVLVILTFSGLKYYQYASKVINHRVLNSEIRESVCNKLILNKEAFLKTEGAKNLTYKEYLEIKALAYLPEISESADSISYSYTLFDEFLGDYNFSVSYVVPLKTKVDSSNYINKSYTKKQSFEIKNNLKYVSYVENKM